MTSQGKPTVLIVGAGLGGLMLGTLLEKINIPYVIFERTSFIKPLGSAISIGPPILALFQQLGIYEELVREGLRYTAIVEHRDNMQPQPFQDFTPLEELTGYSQHIIARPVLYDLLLRQIPANKILLNKRILSIMEDDDKVTIHAADNTIYKGDLVVGADGAYSVVRKQMYEKLKRKGWLPKGDDEGLPFNYTCLVGQTTYMDSDKFPIFKNPSSQSGEKFGENDNPEWGPNAAKQMCDETRDFRTPIKGSDAYLTLGDLYDRTPQDRISKVMLEEKVFETWYHGRTVLIGDACHKFNPIGGQGAVTAMHDALALTNLLYTLTTNTKTTTISATKIRQLLFEYQQERRPKAQATFKNSRVLSFILRKDLVGTMVRSASKNMPVWLWRIFLAKAFGNRPQAGFLEKVEVKGTAAVYPSPSMEKARAVFEERKRRDAGAAAASAQTV
ncbi:hypothetical protein BGX24_001085 [Mortierella sp. AD032]|nr:hypothetical protein BGX24_001085 [Mortierella sp. AD032]